MYQVIARKYRPQSFEDVVGQDHVKSTLRNAIQLKRIAHGYIFSGQRGTGKTTMARIFARCLNCIQGPTADPCGVCASCTEIASGSAVDVIEIDAASNRGINEMRELRENVRYQPSRDRYKIFIVDEAHQITNEAFNALLKTIEEPPPWAVFLLCTTESHKIPATIASRCQHFSFRSVDFDLLMERLRWICGQEGVTADDESLSVIALAGEGSVRDSLSALDQAIACSGNTLDAADVRALVGAFSVDAMSQAGGALLDGDPNRMLDLVDDLERNGKNLQHFARELSRYLRNLLVSRIAGADSRLIAATPREREEMAKLAGQFSEEDLTRYLQLSLDLFRDLQASLQPRFHLEIGLLRLIHAGRLTPLEELLTARSPLAPGCPAPSPSSPRTSSAPVSAPAAAVKPRGPSPFEMDRARKAGTEPKASASDYSGPSMVGATALAHAPALAPLPDVSAVPESNPAPAGSIDWRDQLLTGLTELGLTFTADAITHAEVQFQSGELSVRLPQEFRLVANAEELQKAIKHQKLGPLRIKLSFGQTSAPTAARPSAQKDDALMQRALDHPEVQRFRELFGGEIRTVRNLKE